MSEGAPVASKGPAAGLVELERELEALLVEYESLSRAKIGHRRVQSLVSQRHFKPRE